MMYAADGPLLQADSLPECQRHKERRLCPACRGFQALIGFYDSNSIRHWVYVPAECSCGQTYITTERINVQMAEEKQPMSYIGRKPCGCVVAAVCDDPRIKKQLAKTLSNWIRCDMTVERVSDQYVRDNLKPCRCEAVEAHDRPSF